MALCQVAFMDQHISGRAALQSLRPDSAFQVRILSLTERFPLSMHQPPRPIHWQLNKQ